MSGDLRSAFVGDVVPLPLAGLRLELGVVDASVPGVAEGISRLLFRSIGDARATLGGHLPDWLVGDVERNYISPEKVRTLWAPYGHRFCVMRAGEIVGTVLLTKTHETIFTVDRRTCNVPASRFPGFKPERHHHMVNLSVLHELRRARIGIAMLDGIIASFRELFDGEGIWVRADPPWHAGLVGLGFEHDPSRDLFLPETAERTAGLSHAELNARYACTCTVAAPFDPEALAKRAERMQREKLQYVSFTRAFDAKPARIVAKSSNGAATIAASVALAVTSGQVEREAVVLTPGSIAAAASMMREATAHDVSVVVRGREQSTAALSRAERGLVLSTSGLDAIVAEDGASITVGAGITWGKLLRTLAPKGLVPRVVPGWVRASVGGTLASGGIGKGTIHDGLAIDHVEELVVVTGDGRIVETTRKQAAWLHEAVLGGLGQVGVVVQAKLALRSAPKEVAVYVARVEDLVSAFGRITADPATWHATAFASERGWNAVQVIEAADDARPAIEGARCVALTPAFTYLEAARPAPPEGTVYLQMVLPAQALEPWLDVVTSRLADDASVQVIPIRKVRARAAGALVRLPEVAVGETVYSVIVTRPSSERVLAENHELLGAAQALGGVSMLGGTLPREGAEWDAHFGSHREAFETARVLADPRGVLSRTLPGLTRPSSPTLR